MRRRNVAEAERILEPEPGAGRRRVTVTGASGSAPRVALLLGPYASMPGDDAELDDSGGTILERGGRAYMCPEYDLSMLDACFEVTEEQYIEAMASESGTAILVVTVEYLD